MALEKKIAGHVVLETVIDEKGMVKNLWMVTSPNPLLTKAAIDAVKQWVYEPYVENGKAKSVVFTVTVTFNLKDK